MKKQKQINKVFVFVFGGSDCDDGVRRLRRSCCCQSIVAGRRGSRPFLGGAEGQVDVTASFHDEEELVREDTFRAKSHKFLEFAFGAFSQKLHTPRLPPTTKLDWLCF